MKTTSELVDLLSLKDKGTNTFDGFSKDIGSPIVFGGQVLAQAIHAAYKTINNNRLLNSLHSYFLEPGDLTIPITYKVEILRDGGSFSTRRVTAFQKEKPIFLLAASFHKDEDGYDYSIPMKKEIKQPEHLLSWDDIYEKFGSSLPLNFRQFLAIDRPIDFKPVELPNLSNKKDLPPCVDVWFKLKGDVANLSIALKHQILTYVSDYNMLTTCLNPHASQAHFGNTRLASLDHSMWFHRKFDFNDWLLFSITVENNFGARGLTKGSIYSRSGELIATLTQEGLMRKIK